MGTISTDVLVIGAGAAGIRAALAACEVGVDVILTARGELCRGAPRFFLFQWAAGRVKRLRGCAFPCSGTCEDMESLGYMSQDALAKPIVEIKRGVRDAMGKYGMVLRSKKGLGKCLVALCDLEIRLEEIKLKGTISPIDYFEARNMILTGKLVAKSALERKESLGSHFREDFIKN